MRKFSVLAASLILVGALGYAAHGQTATPLIGPAGTATFGANAVCKTVTRLSPPAGYSVLVFATMHYRTTGMPVIQGVQFNDPDVRVCLTGQPGLPTGVDWMVVYAPVS